jgi:pterin-4a-carbinolamine dehydratase
MSESNIQASPGSIFICYRREDSADTTGRIYDRLVDHFGPERVFMDVEAIKLGYDFRSEIDQTIKVCSIVIVVIGDEWLAQVGGKRRIDDENDRVRIEIEAALRREIPIIPVLARGVSHPTKAMLPASLEALAYRHGTSIRHEHFRGDVDSLISQMDKLLARQERAAESDPEQDRIPVDTPRVGKPPEPLDPKDERALLAELNKTTVVWTVKESKDKYAQGGFRRELHRLYEFETFDAAFQFMKDVTERAIIRYNHHPRWQNAYNRVEVWLTTFNLGSRLSVRDRRLAKLLEQIWEEHPKGASKDDCE